MCGDSNVLTVIYFIKVLIDIIQIAVPIILILLVAIDIFKMVMSSDVDTSKGTSKVTKRMVAAAAVFFVPALVSFLFSLIGSSSDAGLLCLNNANLEDIEIAKAQEKLEEDKDKKAIEDEKKKADEERKRLEAIREEQRKENEEDAKEQEENNNNNNNNNNDSSNSGSVTVPGVPNSNSYKPFVNGVQRNLQEGDCMSQEDKCFCPTVGNYPGFQFTVGDATTRSFNWTSSSLQTVYVKVECSDGSSIGKYVVAKGESQFRSAFEKICKLKTTGINGIKINNDLLFVDGTYVKRLNSARTICSPHSYAKAIDINYNMTVTVNGKDYRPWAGQGTSTKKNYDAFVAALGREDDPRNVNYILWKYAFEPSGFIWGGNWSDGSFDPMHYELK